MVDDELSLTLVHEKAELESELAELSQNLVAADHVLAEAQAEHEQALRAEAVVEAETFRRDEEALWTDIVKAWRVFLGVYEELGAHQLRVAASRPNAFLPSEQDAFVVTPTPTTLEALVSVLIAAGNAAEYEARHVDANGVLRRIVPPFVDRRVELSADMPSRRSPVTNR